MTLACTIQGNPVSIQAGTFNANYTLNNRPTGSFAVYYDGAVPGDEGDEVIITRVADSYKVFAGRVTSVTLSQGLSGNRVATFQVGGYESLADRRIVAEVYFNRTAGYIVADLITKYLSGDGVTAGTIDAGASIPRAVFGYRQLSDVLRTLADANGYIWYIDRDKALHFTERDAVASPNAIDSGTAGDARAIRGVSYDKSLTQYRNRQFVQYNELTSLRTERFAGDGQTKTWSVEFPIASKPVVDVNGIAKTVGISGLDPEGSFDFYWAKGSKSVAQDLLAVPLSVNGAIDRIDDEVDVPFLNTIDASGTHVIATHHDSSTGDKGVVLMRITPTSIDKVYELSIVTDENSVAAEASWINENYVIIQYYTLATNQYTQQVYRREGDLLIDTTASMNEAAVFAGMRSNGRNIVGVKATFNDYDLLLWTYNVSANTIAQTDTIAYDTAYSLSDFAIDGQYVVYSKTHLASPFTNPTRIGLIKIDSSADTWTLVDEIDITGSDTYVQQRCAIIGTYAFFFANVGISKVIRIYRINTTTDEFEFVSTYQLPSTYNGYSVDYINVFGSTIVLGGAFVAGDLIILHFDFTTETLSVNGAYEDDINGVISISQAGYGVYDRVAVGDNFVRAFRFAPDVLKVVYFGTFPNVTQIDDFTEQAARIATEGGTGIYEAFQSASDTDSEPNAIDIAQAILERYGRIPRSLNAETRVEGYEAGQIVTVNWPSLGITSEDFLIERMGIRDESATSLWYSLRLISGRDIGNWQEFWRSLRPSSSFDFGGSDTLPKAVAVADMVGMDDEATAVSAATQTNWNEGNWSEMEWQSRI